MIAAVKAGADVVDVATDAMCGLTSQPSMGAMIASLKETPFDTQIDLNSIQGLNDYWEQVRQIYSPFESGQKSAGADVFLNEMPGGQYTNLLFQSRSLGLADQWPKVKKAFSEANDLLGDIVKVTPSSKVVGDLAQYMVTNKLTPEDVKQNAKELDFPSSVIDYFQGYLGIPYGGFPEPLRTDVIKDLERISGRPGASLPPLDLEALKAKLIQKHGNGITEQDVMSSAMYPKVFDDFMEQKNKYGDVSVLATKQFISPLEIGKEEEIILEKGKLIYVKLTSIGAIDKATGVREVFFDLNGIPRSVKIQDKEAQKTVVQREKANPSDEKSVGAPMPGSVIDLKVKIGDVVEKGQPVVVLSAMKMETVVRSSAHGKVVKLEIKVGDQLNAGDLLLKLE
jgi:pyruvate carboxylase